MVKATQILQVYRHAVKGFVRMNFNALLNALKHLDDVTITEEIKSLSSVECEPVYAWGLDVIDQQTGTNNQYSTSVTAWRRLLWTLVFANHEDLVGVLALSRCLRLWRGDSDLNGLEHTWPVSLISSCSYLSFIAL
jgi:hypothetical protein